MLLIVHIRRSEAVSKPNVISTDSNLSRMEMARAEKIPPLVVVAYIINE